VKSESFYYYAGMCFLIILIVALILAVTMQSIVLALCALALIPAAYTSFVLSKLHKMHPESS
jgi:hypothetical protein